MNLCLKCISGIYLAVIAVMRQQREEKTRACVLLRQKADIPIRMNERWRCKEELEMVHLLAVICTL